MSAPRNSDSAGRAVARELLRVVTYNIHRGRGLDGQVSLRRIAEVDDAMKNSQATPRLLMQFLIVELTGNL